MQDTEDAVLGGSPDYVIDAIDNIDTKVPCPLGPHE
jgi:tRNA A37 threonylcarbamoyladenosine dehydratase